MFVKGTGWCTMDSSMDFSRARYDRFLTLARLQHVQMLRGWGSGMPETDDFYDLCDRKGILVLQEWPTAWDSHLVQPYDVLEETVRLNTLRLRNHPSLAMYGGGNESGNPFGKAIDMMGRYAVELDGTRAVPPRRAVGRQPAQLRLLLGPPAPRPQPEHDGARSSASSAWPACPSYESVLRYLPEDEKRRLAAAARTAASSTTRRSSTRPRTGARSASTRPAFIGAHRPPGLHRGLAVVAGGRRAPHAGAGAHALAALHRRALLQDERQLSGGLWSVRRLVRRAEDRALLRPGRLRARCTPASIFAASVTAGARPSSCCRCSSSTTPARSTAPRWEVRGARLSTPGSGEIRAESYQGPRRHRPPRAAGGLRAQRPADRTPTPLLVVAEVKVGRRRSPTAPSTS